MEKKLTRKELLAKVEERRKKVAIEKRLAERKALLESRKEASKKVAPRPASKKITERKVNRPNRTITETRGLVNQAPRTYVEAKRQAMTKVPAGLRNTANILFENTIQTHKNKLEATQLGFNQSQLGLNDAGVDLIKTYFDIWLGYYPTLITPLIASEQPIKTERARVFFREFVAGSDKGKVAKGDVMITPFGVNTDEEYTSNRVTIAKNSTLPTWGPVVPQSVKIEGFNLTWSDDETFTGLGADAEAITGAITFGTGTINVAISGTDAASVSHVTYEYDNAYAPTQVPELQTNIKPMDIQAKYRTLKTNFSFTAGYGFEAAYGVSLSEDLANAAMFELKRETDLDFVHSVMNAAPRKVVWNRSAGLAVGNYETHKLNFYDAVVKAANTIYAVSKRARGNVLLVGVGAQSIVETLPYFDGDAVGSQLDGPKVIGTLNKNIKVIAIPDLKEDDWAVIYKSAKDNLDAGIIYAPYIPVLATDPVMLDDMLVRRAFITAYGKLIVNPDYFVAGSIIDAPTALPIQVLDKDGDIIEDFSA